MSASSISLRFRTIRRPTFSRLSSWGSEEVVGNFTNYVCRKRDPHIDGCPVFVDIDLDLVNTSVGLYV